MKIAAAIKKKQALLFPVLDIFMNLLNYLFHIINSWFLSKGDYGKLNALLGLSAILIVAGISLQTYTAKTIAAVPEKASNTIGKAVKIALVSVFLIAIVLVAAAGKIMEITSADLLTYSLLGAIFVMNIFLCILRGVFQGTSRFLLLNASLYLEVAVKIIVLFILLLNFRNTAAPMTAILAGMAVSFVHGIISLYGEVKEAKAAVAHISTKEAASVALIYGSNFFIYFFTSIDLFLANYILKSDSGEYSVIVRYSQLITFAFSSFLTVFLPGMASSMKEKGKFRKSLAGYSFIIALFYILIIAAYGFVLPATVKYMFGQQYGDAAGYLFWGALVYIPISAIFFLINVNIVLEAKRFLPLLLIIAVSVVSVLLNCEKSVASFLKSEAAVYWCSALMLGIVTFLEVKKNGDRKDKA